MGFPLAVPVEAGRLLATGHPLGRAAPGHLPAGVPVRNLTKALAAVALQVVELTRGRAAAEDAHRPPVPVAPRRERLRIDRVVVGAPAALLPAPAIVAVGQTEAARPVPGGSRRAGSGAKQQRNGHGGS